MKDFFSTLFKWNWPNIGKAAVGIGAGILTIAAIPALPFVMPPLLVALSTSAVTIGAVFGIHAVHISDPPKTPDQIVPK